MPATTINFTLTTFLINVLNALKARTGAGDLLEGVGVIKMYPLSDLVIEDLPLPAILVDLYEVEPVGKDSSTGQLVVNLMMQLYIVYAGTVRGAPLKIMQLAMAAGAIISDGGRFGGQVDEAKVTDIISQPKLQDENRQYLIWSVEWQHETWIASHDELCDDPAVDADEIDRVLLGFNAESESDYEEVISP